MWSTSIATHPGAEPTIYSVSYRVATTAAAITEPKPTLSIEGAMQLQRDFIAMSNDEREMPDPTSPADDLPGQKPGILISPERLLEYFKTHNLTLEQVGELVMRMSAELNADAKSGMTPTDLEAKYPFTQVIRQ